MAKLESEQGSSGACQTEEAEEAAPEEQPGTSQQQKQPSQPSPPEPTPEASAQHVDEDEAPAAKKRREEGPR